MKYYLAYGSNMNRGQMAIRCPGAEIVGKTYLEDYELFFAGRIKSAVASIRPKEGGRVPVLIWTISPLDERALDIYEGFPRFYKKQTFNVDVDGNIISAMAYVMTERPASVEGIPSSEYYETISMGYREAKIPQKPLKDAYRRTLTNEANFDKLREQMKNGEYKCCPRCGAPMETPERHALSRRADITICDKCGMVEAILDAIGQSDTTDTWYCMTEKA